MPLVLFFFLQIALTVQGLLWFYTHFRIACSISVKNATGIFIGIVLNLQITLGSMDILTILILPIHKHGISFHLFVSSSIYFINVLQFSAYRCFTSLVKFISNYFVFHAVIDGIVFLISPSDSLLLMNRSTTDFCMLILQPAILLNLFINSTVFWWTLGFYIYIQLYHLQMETILLLPFQFGCLCLFLFSNCSGQDFQYYAE